MSDPVCPRITTAPKARGGRVALILSTALAAACASPGARIQAMAERDGLGVATVQGQAFRHLTVFKAGPTPGSDLLHVYIDGDGMAWLRPDLPSPDPSPRTALMFEAMRLDPGPALYLGRPCHFVGTTEPPCSPLQWTMRRYAPETVESLAAVLHDFLTSHPTYRRVVFFGHSGGGTLATLMAPRFAETVAIVTLAANLDVGAWTRLHGYSPLTGSLDPIHSPALPANWLQWHLAGERDTAVPPSIVRSYAERHPGAQVMPLAGYDHDCCWLDLWPALPQAVDAEVTIIPGAAP
ncbi:MAG: hypothetical protein KDG55_22975 [Rhodocyclaceae bacterium]|nr:hypothetical protein [Rhodocyclaceae bacterium]